MSRKTCSFPIIKPLLLRRFMSIQKNVKSETYYDILKLDKGCSGKDIRNAYVELSKKLHPDVSGKKSQSEFLKVLEAYNVLSKPHLRSSYDQELLNKSRSPHATDTRTTEFHKPWEMKSDYEPHPGSYYGIKGLPRITNAKVALLFLALGIFFSIIGFSSVNHFFSYHPSEIDKKSAKASTHHANVRDDAEKYGNEEQLRRMATRILNREASPTKKFRE